MIAISSQALADYQFPLGDNKDCRAAFDKTGNVEVLRESAEELIRLKIKESIVENTSKVVSNINQVELPLVLFDEEDRTSVDHDGFYINLRRFDNKESLPEYFNTPFAFTAYLETATGTTTVNIGLHFRGDKGQGLGFDYSFQLLDHHVYDDLGNIVGENPKACSVYTSRGEFSISKMVMINSTTKRRIINFNYSAGRKSYKVTHRDLLKTL